MALLGAGTAEAPVADAAMKGDTEALRTLLREGADVNAAHGDGMSALHWAAERGNAEMVEILLYAGAAVEAVTRIGEYTPLHLATRVGSLEVVRALIDEGANVHVLTDPSGSSPLHLAATAGNPSVVRVLLEHGADANAREARWAQTPLIFAAAGNRVEVIQALVEGGADPNLASEGLDLTEQGPIDQAASRRQSEVLDAFTNNGASLPTSAQIQAAVRAGREIYVTGLPEGVDDDSAGDGEGRGGGRGAPRIVSKGGLTPLLHAARQGHLEAMTALIDLGANIDQVGGGDGTTPLLISSINGQFDAAMLLLERGADPNLVSTLNGATPLWATVNSEWQPRTRYPQPQERERQEVGYLELIEALLAAGADPDARMTNHPWYMEYSGCGNGMCGLIDVTGSTAFLRAAYATDVDAMRLLYRWGADPNVATKAPRPRQRRNRDEEARQAAMERLGDVERVAEMTDSTQSELLQLVWAPLPDSLKKNYPEFTITETPSAVRDDLLAMAQRFDSIKAAEPDPSGLPPVPVGGPAVAAIHAASGVGYGEGFAGNAHRHADNGWLPSVKFLVEEVGIDVNLRDHNGYTAVHHAAARGENEMILYLVEMGGDVTVISRRGQTTADMANGPVSRVSPIPETVALLESLGSANSHNCLTCQ